MKILIAEDEFAIQVILQEFTQRWGFQPITVANGEEALVAATCSDVPPIAILDWGLPGKDGIEVCRAIKDNQDNTLPYIILLTGRSSAQDILTGLEAGADDYITKPFEMCNLQLRLNIAMRVVDAHQKLVAKVDELEKAHEHVKHLHAILPICIRCHQIQNDEQSRQQVTKYIKDHAEIQLNTSICSECLKKTGI